jgi:hypothetical protein
MISVEVARSSSRPEPKTPISPRLRGKAHAEFRRFRDRLLNEVFSKERRADPRLVDRVLADQARRMFQAEPGRPNNDLVTRAYEMRLRGKLWEEVYSACRAETPEDKSRLRKAVHFRKVAVSRNARRLKPSSFVAPI